LAEKRFHSSLSDTIFLIAAAISREFIASTSSPFSQFFMMSGTAVVGRDDRAPLADASMSVSRRAR
jgi:hypothetical protein